ncbi:hypothetical protein GEMRC1_004223 [Eukaryota sp. GEM-RC1]
MKVFVENYLREPTNVYRKEHSRFSFSLSLMFMVGLVGITLWFFVTTTHTCGPFSGKKPADVEDLLKPLFFITSTAALFAWFRSSVGFTAKQCFEKELILRKKATNAAVLDLKKKLDFLKQQLAKRN